jgi:transposase
MSHRHLWPLDMAVYLHRVPVDFRKQINGLAVLVAESMQLDPFAPALYVFVNGARNRIKVLYWDQQGYCLWLKRLEKHRFVWPLEVDEDVIELGANQLNWLIGGFDVFRFAPHQVEKYAALT